MFDTIEKLLILQDRDKQISRLRTELAHIEPERQGLKTKAADAQGSLERARHKVKEIESRRKGLELEVETKKQLIDRYANQQLQTRKNEEYRALAHEIEMCKEAIFTQEALRIGLVQRVVPKGQAVEEAKKLLKKIMSKGPVAIKMAKKAINEGLGMSLRQGLDLECQCEAVSFGSEDKDEGAKAFLEKRPAQFKGK